MKQIINYLKWKWVKENNIFYIHLEDERLINFDITDLRESWEYYINNCYKKWDIFLFLDEVQNINWWEKFIRNIQEQYSEKVQIFITGSNSNLLSSELSTILTWRYLDFTIYPLSFKEYLSFNNISFSSK